MARSNSRIRIVNKDLQLPYSKGLMTQSLMAAGIAPDRAYSLATKLERILEQRHAEELTVPELHAAALDLLERDEGAEAAQRFRRWTILKRKDVPIVMLIGGTTGSGKSTVAAQVAHRLGITRVTSTDMVRQVMRSLFSPELMPVLHHSSFDAPLPNHVLEGDAHDLGILSFLEQARQVSIGTQAVIERAERERMSTLVEGVHLVPGLTTHVDLTRVALVEVVVYIEDPQAHRSHFSLRDLQTDGSRPMDHYLANFDRIREIQDYLIRQAERRGVPVIENTFLDSTVQRLTDFTLDVVERVAQDAEFELAPPAVPMPARRVG